MCASRPHLRTPDTSPAAQVTSEAITWHFWPSPDTPAHIAPSVPLQHLVGVYLQLPCGTVSGVLLEGGVMALVSVGVGTVNADSYVINTVIKIRMHTSYLYLKKFFVYFTVVTMMWLVSMCLIYLGNKVEGWARSEGRVKGC